MEIPINPWIACLVSGLFSGLAGWLITAWRYQQAFSYIEIEDDLEDLGRDLIAAKQEGKTEFSIDIIDANCSIVFVDNRAKLERLLRN